MDSVLDTVTPTEELALELFQQCIDNKQISILELSDVESIFSQFIDAAVAIEKAIKAKRNIADTSGLNIFPIKKDR